MRGELPHFNFPSTVDRRIGARSFLRLLALLALFAIAGCSADEVHSPLTFFPGSQSSSWSDCDNKPDLSGNEVLVCAALDSPQAPTKATKYTINFYLPRSLHVRLAVFDSHAALVKLLLDQDENGTVGTFRYPPIIWDFTDAQGNRVPKGDYRCYLSAGDYLSFSDVAVP